MNIFEQNDSKGYVVYSKFLALKQHFTLDKYDYFKYKGKVRGTFDSFKTRRDKYYFNKLHDIMDYEDIIVANMIHNPKVWIGELLDENTGIQIYREWKKRTDGLTYLLSNDLKKLNDENFMDNFRVVNKQPPHIVKLALQKKISFETLSILLDVTNTYDYIMENVDDIIIAVPFVKKAKKYLPFLKYDKNKVHEAIERSFEI